MLSTWEHRMESRRGLHTDDWNRDHHETLCEKNSATSMKVLRLKFYGSRVTQQLLLERAVLEQESVDRLKYKYTNVTSTNTNTYEDSVALGRFYSVDLHHLHTKP